jgi:hypothetical protein
MNRVEALQQMTNDQILTCVDLCDGHTIFRASAFTDRGLPKSAVDAFAKAYLSDGTAKGSIIDLETGAIATSMQGIYGLDFLRHVAKILCVEYEDKMGRGFQARAIQKAIHDNFEGRE